MATKPQRDRPPRPPKKQWQRPRIKSGQLFESNSLACGKNSPMTEECQQVATNS
jgi:hypothetical protein